MLLHGSKFHKKVGIFAWLNVQEKCHKIHILNPLLNHYALKKSMYTDSIPRLDSDQRYQKKS